MRYFFALLFGFALMAPSVASATPVTFSFKLTFDYAECDSDGSFVGDIVCFGEPPNIDPYAGYYDDLTKGDWSHGRVSFETKDPFDRAFSFNGEIGKLLCDDMFGRSARCNNNYFNWFDYDVGKLGEVGCCNDDPGWLFDFDNRRARIREGEGSSAAYYAYFDISEIRGTIATAPLPAALPMLLAGVMGFGVLRRRSRKDKV